MHVKERILGTDEAWDSGVLGNDETFVEHLGEEELDQDKTLIENALGLRPISIRLETSLIEDFKNIAAISGLGYQPLMRQALKRFAESEKKRLVREMAANVTRSKSKKKMAA